MKKIRNIIIAVLSIVCLSCLFAGCTKGSVIIDKSEITIEYGKTAQLTATVTDIEEEVVWSSSNESIVKVDQEGKVTAVEEGTATITAKAGKKTATCKVTVGEYQLAVTLNKTSVTLNPTKIGEDGENAYQLKTTVKANKKSATPDTISYKSSNESVATVSDNGLVTATGLGETTITVTVTKDGREKSATATVNVEKVTVSNTVELPEMSLTDTNYTFGVNLLGIAPEYQGDIAVKANGEAVENVVIDNGNVVMPNEFDFGELALEIEVSDRIINANTLVVTKVLKTKQDVIDFVNMEKDYEYIEKYEYHKYTYDGYYVLGNNIDMEGAQIANTIAINTSSVSYGFKGTFDGRGYAIMNATVGVLDDATTKDVNEAVAATGMFGVIADTGVVKNFAFVNITMYVSDSNEKGMLATVCNGTLENVLVSGSMGYSNYNNGSAVYRFGTGSVVNNYVAIVEAHTERTSDTLSHSFNAWASYISSSATPKSFTNVYGIGVYGMLSGVGSNYIAKLPGTFYGLYEENKEFNLDGEVWDLSGEIPTFKGLGATIQEYYTGNIGDNGKYSLADTDVVYAPVGSTVTMAEKTLLGATTTVKDNTNASKTIGVGVTTLSIKYQANYEPIMVHDANTGIPINMQYTFYSPTLNSNAPGSYIRSIGTLDGVNGAYEINSVNEWYSRTQLLVDFQGNGQLATKALKAQGYKTLRFMIRSSDLTKKLYMTLNTTEATVDGSKTVSYTTSFTGATLNFAKGTYDSKTVADDASKYVKVTYIDGFEVETDPLKTNDTLKANRWYIVTVDISAMAATNNNLYISTTNNTSYYLANFTVA